VCHQKSVSRGRKEINVISKNFKDLGLSGPIIKTLARLGITEPTDIQAKAIPPALAGKDIMGSAETGSGKTAAFLLPIIERLRHPGRMRALILAPTRELANQIEENARDLSAAARLRTLSVVGGEGISKQIKALDSGADILIATPGRLNDLIRRDCVNLDSIEVLVLDEADRMLDMGFLPQVKQIMKHLRGKRQTLLMTATLSKAVEQLASQLMQDYVRIEVERPAATVATLCQKVFPVLSHAKMPLLLALLEEHLEGGFLVFTRTRRGADRLSHVLAANKHQVVTLHSDRSQSQRNRALESFRSGHSRVLVATDVAARGIDVDDIAFVINYEVPATAQDYIHRVGRTARAGRTGSALTFVSPEEEPILASIEQETGASLERARLKGFSDGRSDEQVRRASEIGRLRSPQTRSYSRRASRH
jgi:ATP-dependent RNA helicase RhlE